MAMIAGAYKLVFNSSKQLGVTESGFTCSLAPALIPVRTDEFGRSVIDFIFAGIESGFVRADVLYGSGSTAFTFDELFPWMSPAGTIGTGVGVLASAGSLLKPLTLESLIGAQADYDFEYAMLTSVQRNFSSTRLVTYTMEFQTIINSSNSKLFTVT